MTDSPSRAPLIAFLLGVTVWVATASYLRREYPGDWGDDGQYLVSARSLCDLKGYRLISRPGDPVATKYPIGVPAITAFVMALLPGEPSTRHDWLAGRIVVIVAGVVLALASRRFFALSGFSAWPACLLALAVTWFPLMIHLTATLMSDIPFTALCGVLAVRWIRRSRSGPARGWVWMIDGILAGLGWLIRANGFTLVIAAVVAALQSRPRWGRVTAVVIGVACLKVPASLYLLNLSGPRDSGNYFTEQVAAYQAANHLWSLPLTNLSRLPRLLLATICSPTEWTGVVLGILDRWTVLRWLASTCAGVLLVCGMTRLIRQRRWPAAIWVHAGLTLAIFVLWHFPIDHRFILPLIPLLLAACAIGTEVIVKHRAMIPLFCAGSLVSSLVVVLGMIWRSHSHGGIMLDRTTAPISAMLKTISSETSRDSVIICAIPEFVYLNTGRKSAPLKDEVLLVGSKPLSLTQLEYWISLAQDRPLYLIADDLKSANEIEFWKQDNTKFQLTQICTIQDGYLWKIDRTQRID